MGGGSSLSTATGYGLDDRASIPGKANRFLFSKASISPLEATQPAIIQVSGVKLTTHFHLVPRSRMI
jgi:hypothetical protein